MSNATAPIAIPPTSGLITSVFTKVVSRFVTSIIYIYLPSPSIVQLLG
jgi:hypothetical protein